MSADQVTHPNTLAAVAALSRLRQVWSWLGDMLEPGQAAVAVERTLSPAAAGRLNRRARVERADLLETFRAGLAPAGTSPAPVRVAVLDAQVLAVTTLVDSAWIVSSALRTRGPMLTFGAIGARADDDRFTAAAEYLAVTIRLIDPDLAGTVGADLDHADRIARVVAGVGPDHRPVKADCPACGRRSLLAEVSAADQKDWTVSCCRPDCRCRGVDCGCRRPIRYPGNRHIWPASEFDQLDRLLGRTAA